LKKRIPVKSDIRFSFLYRWKERGVRNIGTFSSFVPLFVDLWTASHFQI